MKEKLVGAVMVLVLACLVAIGWLLFHVASQIRVEALQLWAVLVTMLGLPVAFGLGFLFGRDRARAFVEGQRFQTGETAPQVDRSVETAGKVSDLRVRQYHSVRGGPPQAAPDYNQYLPRPRVSVRRLDDGEGEVIDL